MIVLLLLAAQSQEGDVTRLFTRQADIRVSKPGLQRVLLPASVVSQCKADLADLRVMGAQEIPYIVDSQRNLVLDKLEVLRPELRMLKRQEEGRHSKEVFELLFRNEVNGQWELQFETPKSNFVRSVEVVDDNGGARTAGAIFRLPGKQRLVLPVTLQKTKRFVITIEGENDGYLEPSAALSRRTLTGPHGGSLTVPLTSKSETRGKQSVLSIDRPRGLVPTQITLSTQEYAFDRAVRIFDVDVNGETLIGEGSIFRLSGDVAIEDIAVNTRPARGDKLRIEIDNKDSQPLELTVNALIDQPALVFAATQTTPLTLLFGGGRVHRPEYDIAGLLPRGVVTGKRQDAAERLFTLDQLSPAELSEPRDNPRFDRTPFLQFAMRAGAGVDARAYQWRAPFRVDASGEYEGLSLMVPTVEDVAHAKEDLSDLRVVDKQARQWPYLLVRDRNAVEHDLVVTQAPEGKKTRYTMQPAAARVRASSITLQTEAPYFDRHYELSTQVGDRKVVVAEGRLRREANVLTPTLISFPARDVGALSLLIDDGDDAALRFSRIAITTQQPALFIAAPAGDYYLLAGNAADNAPSYELERIRDAVLAVASQDVYAMIGAPNPDYASVTRLSQGPGPLQIALWAAMILAVALLAALTLRLSKPAE